MTPAIAVSNIDRFIRLIPTPLLVFLTFVLSMFLVLDLAIPDPVPFIDEAVLLLLFTGSLSALLDRRRASRILGTGDRTPEPDVAVRGLNAGRVMKDLKYVSGELAATAKSLRKGGHPAAALDSLAALPAETKLRVKDLKAAEAYLSRRDHDPYQLDREAAKLEHAAAHAEAEGDQRVLAHAREALAAVQARRAEVLSRRDRRDDLLLSMHRLATQSGALLEDLRAVGEGRAAPLLTEGLSSLDARFAAVVADLGEARTAEAEVEQTLSRPKEARPGRSAASPKVERTD
jgi:hypothetical protein